MSTTKMKNSIICTTYFSKKKHPNNPNDAAVIGRDSDGRVLQNNISYIKPWYDSIDKLDLNGIVFYDNLDTEFVNKYQTHRIKFIKVNPSYYSNNDWRFFIYRDYFHDNKYDSVFLTDGSDVSVVKNPHEVVDRYNYIDFFVCKDSILLNQFPYIQIHNQAKWENLHWFIKNQQHLPLINMGVIGGKYSNIQAFLIAFCETRIKLGNPDFNSDMWIGQYVFRYILSHKNLLIGEPFTSIFKQYENERKDVYFIHK
jgi:hypothetical protein